MCLLSQLITIKAEIKVNHFIVRWEEFVCRVCEDMLMAFKGIALGDCLPICQNYRTFEYWQRSIYVRYYRAVHHLTFHVHPAYQRPIRLRQVQQGGGCSESRASPHSLLMGSLVGFYQWKVGTAILIRLGANGNV